MVASRWTPWRPVGGDVNNADWRDDGAGRIEIRVARGTINISIAQYAALTSSDPARPSETIDARFHRRVREHLDGQGPQPSVADLIQATQREVMHAIATAVDPSVMEEVEAGLAGVQAAVDAATRPVEIELHCRSLSASIMGDPRVRHAVEAAERSGAEADAIRAREIGLEVAAERIRQHHRACAMCREAAGD